MARRITPSSRPSSNHLSGFSGGNGSTNSNSGSTIGSSGSGSYHSNGNGSAASSQTSHSHATATATWGNNSSKFSAAAAQYNSYAGGTGGSPFPPLGLTAAFSSSPLTEKSPSSFNSTAEAFPPSAFPSLSNASASPAKMPAHNSSNAHHHDSSSSSVGLPPAPTKFDASQAQACRLQDAYWSDDEEDMDCPLCLEEIDLSDANFKPCPCGYQICRFCWHHIKQNLNGRCPACRRKYSDQSVEFTPMSSEEIKRLTQAKKQKEREKKELEQMNRRHLANMRVVQKNLVYVTGLSSKLAKEELIPTLRSQEYFGQYGRISKILISKRTTASKLVMGTQESAIGVYVTYFRKEDAARAIVAIDGTKGSDGKMIRASYGTTKYCTTYLRNLPCTNPACTYLHEPGEEADSFTKEDLSTLRHAAKDSERKARPLLNASLNNTVSAERKNSTSSSTDHHGHGGSGSNVGTPTATSAESEGSALPKTASWGSGAGIKPLTNGSGLATPTGLREHDLPPLSAAVPVSQPSQQSSAAAKKAQAKKEANAAQKAAAIAAAKNTAPTPEPVQPQRPPGITVPSTSGRDTPSSTDATTAHPSPRSTPANLARSSKDAARPAVAAGPPPGLAAPPTNVAAQSPAGDAEKEDAASTDHGTDPDSGYQPSVKAQALIDDLQLRRSAPVQPSPFPDLDEIVLGSFAKGEFSFNLPSSFEQDNAHSLDGAGNALPAFSPFPQNGSAFGAGFGGVDFGLGRLGSPIVASSNTSVGQAGYTGSFDPFASSEDAGSKSQDSPFAAIDEIKRNLSDERTGTGAEDDKASAEKRGSRFSFNRKKEDGGGMNAFATSSLNASLPSLTSGTSNASSPAMGASPYSANRMDDIFNSPSAGQKQETQDASSLSRNFMDSILGLKTNVNVSSDDQGGSNSGNAKSAGSFARSIGPNPQQVANGTRSWQEQQAAQAQQQHSATRKATFPQYEHHREHQQPLLAQLMASASQRRAESQQHAYSGPQQNHMAAQQGYPNPSGFNDLSFYDPSILTIARGAQQPNLMNSYRQNMQMSGAGAYDMHAPPGFAPRGHAQRPHERSHFPMS